jgi:HAD superfamily hydrolase (TIGR01509 family)
LNKITPHNFEVFTLNKDPDKSNPIYFEKLLKTYNLNKSELIYFDHKKENIKSAENAGIKIT